MHYFSYAEGRHYKAMGKHRTRPSVLDDELYEALRADGASKEKAARIANAAANKSRSAVGRKGGKARPYEKWKKDKLYQRARQLDIDGRSAMSKDELIEALRDS